jgi:ankyrin repeat protein
VAKTAIEGLIERGAHFIAQDKKGRDILHYMTEFTQPKPGLIETAKIISKRTPSLIHQTNEAGDTPLHYALRRKGAVSLVDLLLDEGADPLQADSNGYTGLHHSAKQLGGNRGTFERFLKAGVDINARNKKGNTPIFMYVEQGIIISDRFYESSHSEDGPFKDSIFDMF